MGEQELTAKEIEQRRKAPLKHGGEAAVKAIQAGDSFTGLAAEAEREVYAELEANGRYSLVVRNATRLQAACDLYWNAIEKAAQEKDLKALDRYISRFGWLAGASLRAWAQVKQEERQNEGITPAMVLEAMNDKHN